MSQAAPVSTAPRPTTTTAARSRFSRRAVAIVVAVGLGSALLAPAALAGDLYKGRSGQARPIRLTTDPSGTVKKGFFAVRAPCDHDFGSFKGHFNFKGVRRANPDSFRATGAQDVGKGDYTATYNFGMKGQRTGPRKFKGTLRFTVTFFVGNERYTRCTLDQTHWKAALAG